MKEIDVHYWIKDVELPQIRGSLILEFLDLMDGSYQEREWIEKDKKEYVKNDNKNIRFDANISFSIELFEDMSLDEDVKLGVPPYDAVGIFLKSKQEAEVIYKFAETFYKFKADVYSHHQEDSRPTNQEYLSSPYLEPMRRAAGEAFAVFMENEKDNKEFCEFIAELQEKRGQESLGNTQLTKIVISK